MVELHTDVLSVIASFLSFQDMLIMEIICKDWKFGLYQYCATVKSFQITKKLLFLVQAPIPRPDMVDLSCKNYSKRNSYFTLPPKDQNHRLIVRKMIAKWFGEMFVSVERLHFSDVKFSGDLVNDFFSNKNFCSNVRQLVFVGCYLLKSCAKEFVTKMKNVECIIYHSTDIEDSDLKNCKEFVKSSSLKYLYYPQAELVNLSKLSNTDQNTPYYLELEEDYGVDDSEDAKNHQVIILDTEKTKAFKKAKGNCEETLKMFGIISNEFEELYFKAIELPINECLLQYNKMLNNGMHFFDFVFSEETVRPLVIKHWRHLDKFQVFITNSTFMHCVISCSEEVLKTLSSEEQIEFVKVVWKLLEPSHHFRFLYVCEEVKILRQAIVDRAIEIDLDNYDQSSWIQEIISKYQKKRKTNPNTSTNKKISKKK